jgi:hypothetical protein
LVRVAEGFAESSALLSFEIEPARPDFVMSRFSIAAGIFIVEPNEIARQALSRTRTRVSVHES